MATPSALSGRVLLYGAVFKAASLSLDNVRNNTNTAKIVSEKVPFLMSCLQRFRKIVSVVHTINKMKI